MGLKRRQRHTQWGLEWDLRGGRGIPSGVWNGTEEEAEAHTVGSEMGLKRRQRHIRSHYGVGEV